MKVHQLVIGGFDSNGHLPDGFSEAIRQNHYFAQFSWGGSYEWDLNYYLQLNLGGRRVLKDTHIEKQLWPLVLERPNRLKPPFQRDLQPDVIYHLLRNGLNQIILR